ncbi:hypothetical protein PMAYCL1PPCAC_00704, partial [Pristionchus mayeri]
MNSSTATPSVPSVLDTVIHIYVTFVEPIMTIAYTLMMWRIGRSKVAEFHGTFYRFFILTGIPACLNLLTVIFKPISAKNMHEFSWTVSGFKFLFFASFWFSLSHTVGKV